MSSRREFIKQTSLLLAGIVAAKEDFFKPQKRIGLQLYTVRDQLGKDLTGTIARVASVGYNDVETFAYSNRKFSGLSPKDFSDLLKKNRLQTPSGHYGLQKFLFDNNDDEWKYAIEDAKQLGQHYMIVPWLDPSRRKSIDGYKKIAERLNKAGELCGKAGMHAGYHNHNFEFDQVEGQIPFHVLLKETNPALVNFEMDIYWVTFANQNPVEIIKAHPGRFPLWHVKDMDKSPQRKFTEVGNGIINFKEIFKLKKVSGFKYFFVEQDQSSDPLASIQKSYDYIKKNLA